MYFIFCHLNKVINLVGTKLVRQIIYEHITIPVGVTNFFFSDYYFFFCTLLRSNLQQHVIFQNINIFTKKQQNILLIEIMYSKCHLNC